MPGIAKQFIVAYFGHTVSKSWPRLIWLIPDLVKGFVTTKPLFYDCHRNCTYRWTGRKSLLIINILDFQYQFIRAGSSSYCSYRRRRRALEPSLQIAEFGENVNKPTSSIIRHVFCLAYIFPTCDPIEIPRYQDVIGLGRHGPVLISVIDSNLRCSLA